MNDIENVRKRVWIDCECGLFEHAMRISWFTDEPIEDRQLYIEWVVDRAFPFWDRVKEAFAYVFRSKPYTFAETIITPKAYPQLKEAIDFIAPQSNGSESKTK
jgi:hypothetical protein